MSTRQNLVFAAAVLSCSSVTARAQSVLNLTGLAGDRLGVSLAPAGDFDGDGFPDALVTADQQYKLRGDPTDEDGVVGILSGRNQSVLFRLSGDDYQVRTGRAPGPYFGVNAQLIGDFDADGRSEVLIVHGNSKVLRQAAVFSGHTGAFLFEIDDPVGHTNFGTAIQPLGDILDAQGRLVADGVPDFAISAPQQSVFIGSPSYPGFVYIFSGAAVGNGPVVTKSGVFSGETFGSALAVVGDLDGDGRTALAVGASGGPYVALFDGPGFGLLYVLTPPAPNRFGSVLANLGDLNGDGTTELAVGAPEARQGRGRVTVYSLEPTRGREKLRIEVPNASADLNFGTSIAARPVDPLSGQGLLDLDHDSLPDPFFDFNRDGVPDFLIGARGYEAGAGGVYLVKGTGAFVEEGTVAIHQGTSDAYEYSYLPELSAQPDEGFGTELALLGNVPGESQALIGVGAPREGVFNGALAMLRPSFAHFDDDTFALAQDGVGTQRTLELDFGPRYAGRRYYLLGTTAGTSPGQVIQGFRVPLNPDGANGLWARTSTLQAQGTPLAFSQLTGRLDGSGRATIVVQVTASPLAHPWFSVPRQHYVAVLSKPGRPTELALVGAPTTLEIF